MSLVNNTVMNLYSIVLLIVIYIHATKKAEKETMQYKFFVTMLWVTVVMLVVDILSRFDGNTSAAYSVCNHVGNFLIFLLSPILPSLWLLYVHVHVFQEERKTKWLLFSLLILNAANVILVILTQFFGWYYFIDASNVYHRGPLYILSAFITLALVLEACFIIFAFRKKVDKKYFFSLLFFVVPPIVAIVMQILFYGTSLILSGVVVSLLVVFLDIQNHSIYTDYLTGANNRKRLDCYLREKISASTAEKTFSAILLDMDHFKSINDTYGHAMGDSALQNFVTLLRGSLRPNDFIARYGGDEFCIVLNISNETDLAKIVQRIRDSVKRYNEAGKQPYQFEISTGYAVYNYESHIKVGEFLKMIDALLYENKQANKELDSAGKQ